MNTSREGRLEWAKGLAHKGHVYPHADIRMMTKFDRGTTHPLQTLTMRIETLVRLGRGDKLTICADQYEMRVSSLDELQQFVNECSARMRDLCVRTSEKFIANDDTRDFWFTKKELNL